MGLMEATVAGHHSIARRPSPRPFAVGSIGFALLVALAVWIGSLAPPDGPLVDVHGDLDGAPVTVGVPFTYGSIPLQNVGSTPVVLIRATMGPHTPGLKMVGIGVSRHYAGYTLDPRGYPRLLASSRPGHPRPTMSSLAGTTIPGGPRNDPRGNLATLIVGFRIDNPGDYLLRGMVVTYRAGRLTYTERIGPIMAVCTPKAGHRTCRLPENVSW
jgi:hypothetical protein